MVWRRKVRISYISLLLAKGFKYLSKRRETFDFLVCLARPCHGVSVLSCCFGLRLLSRACLDLSFCFGLMFIVF
jgi:hypothetical protein